MEFMLDTLNLEDIKEWSRILPLAGVTSNPTIAKKEGRFDFFERISQVREIIGPSPSIHVQVIAKDYQGMIRDALTIRENCPGNTYIKLPVTKEGLSAIKALKKDGYLVTATAIYTVFQGLLAIEAGSDYLAPYYNRMSNLNIDADVVIAQLAQAIKNSQSSAKILAASFKNIGQITDAVAQGAHAVTADAAIFEAGFAMPSIEQAVEAFASDWLSCQGKEHV